MIAQRLLPAKEGRKQVACFEVLKGTTNIANMIRDEKTFQIHSAMQIGRSLGMQTFDEALRDLLKRDQITRRDGVHGGAEERRLRVVRLARVPALGE